MPWCDPCAKFWTPTSMNADGTCPSCGASVAADASRDAKHLQVSDLRELAGDEKVPWHFKLMVVAVVGYLGWRLVQLVMLAFN